MGVIGVGFRSSGALVLVGSLSVACGSSGGSGAVAATGGSAGSAAAGSAGLVDMGGSGPAVNEFCIHACTCADGTSAMTACLDGAGTPQCVCKAPDPVPAGAACVAPCGGDPSGEWTATGSCSIALPALTCDQPVTSLTPVSATGGVVFNASTVTYDTVDTDLAVAHLIPNCPNGLAAQQSTCNQLQSVYEQTDPNAACTTNDGCWCKLTIPVQLTGTETYTISGNQLTFATGAPMPFCVQGNTLTLFTVDDGIQYRRGGKTCTAESDCTADRQHCCAQPDSTDSRCQAEACVAGVIGAVCTTDAYCAQDRCADGKCAAPLKAALAACSVNAECASNLCCFQNLATKICLGSTASADGTCPVQPGDPCTAAGMECTNGTCSLAPDGVAGFCTNSGCQYEGGPCAYSSKGNPNYCPIVSTGSHECLPSCAVDADCAAINPALHCFGYPEEVGLCAYDTTGWLDPGPERP
jgi:hypothetical protein